MLEVSHSKFEFAYTTIEKRILSGVWKVGDRLPSEDELAVEFGCSRGTINKALSRLSHEGLLERKPRYGTRVLNRVQQHQTSSLNLNAFAFICPSEEHEGIWMIAQGFKSAAANLNRRALILSSDGDLRREAETIGRLAEFDVRGAAIYPVISKPEDVLLFSRMILSCPFPVVLIGLNLFGLGKSVVTGDGFHAGLVPTEHLISRGIKKIGFLTNYAWTQSMRDRYTGYRSAMTAAGLEINDSWVMREESMQPNFSDPLAASVDLARKYLTANPDIEGVVCAADYHAQGCLIVAEEMGIKVPEQLKLVGMDGFTRLNYAGYKNTHQLRLTSYQGTYHEVGKTAAELLDKALSGVETQPTEIQIKGELVIGETS